MPKQVTFRIAPQDFANENLLKQQIAEAAKLNIQQINAYQILRQSLDAHNRNIWIQLQVNVFVNEPFEDAFAFDAPLQNVSNLETTKICNIPKSKDFFPVAKERAMPAGLFPMQWMVRKWRWRILFFNFVKF